MTQRNPSFTVLSQNYLFPEVAKRKKLFLEQHPGVQLINLSIGDTTEPIPGCIAEELAAAANRLGTATGYSGYGPEQGMESLRTQIANYLYKGIVSADDLFISDGAKCDLGRLQLLFGPEVSIAVPDPAYPVYLDGSLLQGVKKITFMPFTPENNFWPDLAQVKGMDLIYWCSPNNPTGSISSKEQLTLLVAHAKANGSIIIFDAAYAGYIQDPSLPRSIFEIPGAEEVAIEVGSFSKLAGFSGIRLGWTIVPAALKYRDGTSVKADWKRLISTIFNGASNIAQAGGLAVLTDTGMQAVQRTIQFYLENTALLKQALQKLGHNVYGGTHTPYLWVRFPEKESWTAFQEVLEKYHLVTTPGSGFGKAGEGFLRFSAFGHRETILAAISRL